MISNRHITKIIAVIMVFSLCLCFAAMYFSTELTAAAGGKAINMSYESELFDTDVIMTVNILMDEDDWQEMLDNALAEEYYACDVEINGQTFYQVGIRTKGNTSLSSVVNDPTTDRYSLKLEFDHYVDGQTCFGLDKLILNNNYADATNMKEALCYDMFQFLDTDASLYNYAEISVNGEYRGVYLALEAVEDSFLLRNYGTEKGALYKPEGIEMGGGRQEGGRPDVDSQNAGGGSGGNRPSGDGSRPDFGDAPDLGNMPDFGNMFGSGGSGGADLNYTNDDLDSYSTIWDGEVTDTRKADHKRVVKALKNISEGTDLETYMDIDNLLKYMAVHVFSVNMDSLSGNMAHNYYLYESNGQLNLIPWDYNLAFGGMGANGDRSQNNNHDTGDRFADDAGAGDRFADDAGAGDRLADDAGAGSTDDATSVVNSAIDDAFSGTEFFDTLMDNETYRAQYYSYLNQLVQEYVYGDGFETFYNRTRNLIDTLVETDPTAFYTYEEYQTAADTLYQIVKLRAQSIEGQLDGTIPSTSKEQTSSDALIDASSLSVSDMGTMNTGGRR